MLLFLVPLGWNHFLYNEIKDSLNKISYNTFQCIATTALLILCFAIARLTIIGHIPDGYVVGAC
jgi:hypothetical protein